MALCTDCSATIVYIPLLGAWGVRQGPNEGFNLHCRVFFDTEGAVLGVDYHAPNGVQQRRLRIPVEPEPREEP